MAFQFSFYENYNILPETMDSDYESDINVDTNKASSLKLAKEHSLASPFSQKDDPETKKSMTESFHKSTLNSPASNSPSTNIPQLEQPNTFEDIIEYSKKPNLYPNFTKQSIPLPPETPAQVPEKLLKISQPSFSLTDNSLSDSKTENTMLKTLQAKNTLKPSQKLDSKCIEGLKKNLIDSGLGLTQL